VDRQRRALYLVLSSLCPAREGGEKGSMIFPKGSSAQLLEPNPGSARHRITEVHAASPPAHASPDRTLLGRDRQREQRTPLASLGALGLVRKRGAKARTANRTLEEAPVPRGVCLRALRDLVLRPRTFDLISALLVGRHPPQWQPAADRSLKPQASQQTVSFYLGKNSILCGGYRC
jgi:hypothetical protein